MQLKKVTLFILGLVIVVVAVFTLLKAANLPAIKELRSSLKDKSDIFLGNLLEAISPSRRPPLATIELEESLKANLSAPFANFNQDDWKWFWQLLYGKVTVDSGGWPKQKRQLSREEIEDRLIDYYYRPFGYFNERQWGIFWQQILKGKVFGK